MDSISMGDMHLQNAGAGCNTHPHAMQREQKSLPRSRKKTGGFMAVPAWKEAPEQLFCYTCTTSVAVFAFWISFTSVPAFSERFSGRKFHHTEIFCRKPKGKRADPQERANFDEEGGNFSRSDGIIDFLLHLFRPTGQDFHAIVPMGIIAIPSWSEIFLLYWCFSN